MDRKQKTNEDFINIVAKKLDLDPQLVKFVINNFWSTFRQYITHPDVSKLGILLNGFLKFKIRESRIKKLLTKSKETFFKSKARVAKEAMYQTILDNLNQLKCQEDQAQHEEKNPPKKLQ